MSCTRFLLVPFVLCAMGAWTCFLSGCKKEPEAKAPPPYSPESYMKDPAFRRELSDRRTEIQKTSVELRQTMDRLQALVDKYGEDEAKLKKLDEWNELKNRQKELNARYAELKRDQLATVRKRLTPTKEISK